MHARAMMCGPGLKTGRIPRSGRVQAAKGNTCKMDVIDALGLFHFANPNAVSVVNNTSRTDKICIDVCRKSEIFSIKVAGLS